jgi:GT2 family glycosyltransferase
MKPSVVAVVVSHDESEFLARTLAALKAQTRSVDRIILVDTSTDNKNVEMANAAGLTNILKLDSKTPLNQSLHFATQNLVDVDWVWILHDDSAPEVNALAEMLRAVELSPSVAVAGPKLVDWNDSRVVNQLGLTLTPLGDLFSIVSGELDQSQHDDVDDVMAVGTAAVLVRTDVWRELGGLDANAPAYAADFDFSIRARLAGHRVIVVPQARVAHASLSMRGKRERRWLGTSPKAALRRAAIHLRFAYSPIWLVLGFWILLPLIGVIRALGRLSAKRPDRIVGELTAAAWGFFTLPKRLRSRSLIARTSKIRFSKLRSLRATWQQVRSADRAALEREQSEATLAAFERGEFEVDEKSSALGFVASGALWVAAALAVLSFSFWPSGIAVTGGGLLPLSQSWLELFARAGASFQPIGLGYYAPSDPFVWVLTALGSFTFWAPSLALAVILFLAKSIAFAGAWRVVSLFTEKNYVRILAALIFALWPALNVSLQEGRIASVIAHISLPWFVFVVSRAAGIGKNNFSTQTWSWVAASGLLLFLIGASSPNLIPILLVGLAFVVSARIRKFGYLVWIPLPLAAVFSPTIVYYLVYLFKPMALLADPGLPQASEKLAVWQFLIGGQPYGFSLPLVGQISSWVLVPALLLAALALLGKRWGAAFVLWVAGTLALASAWFVSRLEFAAVGVGSSARATDFVNGSPAALLTAYGLIVAVLVALALNQITKATKVVAGLLVALTILPSTALVATAKFDFAYGDSRVVPSIVAAEAAGGSKLKTLVINPEANSDGSIQFGAEIVSGDGVQLEDVSLSYRFALSNLKSERADEYEAVARLVADLASANGTDLTAALQETGIGYVLVPDQTSPIAGQLAISLDSVKELESVGATNYGRLWHVREPNQDLLNAVGQQPSLWSITKVIQLLVLLGFVLLALPTTNQRRRVSGDSQIFVEAGEEN